MGRLPWSLAAYWPDRFATKIPQEMGVTMPDLINTLRDWSMSGYRLHSMIRLAERIPIVSDEIGRAHV